MAGLCRWAVQEEEEEPAGTVAAGTVAEETAEEAPDTVAEVAAVEEVLLSAAGDPVRRMQHRMGCWEEVPAGEQEQVLVLAWEQEQEQA